jgi:PAS domain S-box-containing protein
MRSLPRNKALIIAGFLLCNIVVVVLGAHFILQSQKQHERRAQVVTQNIAKALELSLSGTIEKVDLTLRSVVDEIEEAPAWGGRNPDQIDKLLDKYRARLPFILGLRVTDAGGRVIYGKKEHPQPVSYADRPSFITLRDNPDAGLQITPPLVGQISKRWIISLVRRYNLPDGRFGGIVTCSVALEHFERMLGQFDVGPRGSIALRGLDFAQIARFANHSGSKPSSIGNTNVSSTLRGLVASGAAKGTYRVRTPMDQVDRIFTFHKLSVAPMILTVGLASADFLEEWRRDAMVSCAVIVAFLLVSLAAVVAVFQAFNGIAQKNERLFMVNEHLHQLIDDHQIITAELRESERRYSALFANRINAIAHCRIITNQEGAPVDFEILRVNDAYERIMQVKREAVEGQRGSHVYPGFDRHNFGVLEVFGQVALQGEEVQFEAYFPPAVQYLSIYAYSPQPGEFTTIINDVTERKLADEALRVSESKFRIIFDNAVYGIVIFEYESGRLLDVNQRLTQMYGYSRDELLESSMSVFQLSAEEEKSRAAVLEANSSREMLVGMRQHRRKDGSTFPVEIVGGAYQWDGKSVMFALLHDITERVQAEQNLKSYAQRLIVQEEDLRKNVAMELHDDIGQELTALGLNLAYIGSKLGGAIGMELGSTLEDTRQLTKEISRSVRNLMVEMRPSQLEECGLTGAIASYADQYRERTGLEVTVSIDEGFRRLTSKQEIALFRITQEALNNAAKYANARRVVIILGTVLGIPQLSISDDGNGFVPRATNLQPTGSGWGLTIMRERAELAGGRFHLESTPGKGTSIVVELEEV